MIWTLDLILDEANHDRIKFTLNADLKLDGPDCVVNEDDSNNLTL